MNEVSPLQRLPFAKRTKKTGAKKFILPLIHFNFIVLIEKGNKCFPGQISLVNNNPLY